MRALVTGGAGFIGSHITDALIDAGHTVTVIDDLSRGRREQVNPAATFVELDVTLRELAAAIADARPDVIFHEAAQIDVRESVRDPLHDADVNVVGTVNVLRAAVDAGTRRVVFASSGGAIYGDTEIIPTPEDQPCRPESPYGTAKLCAEAYGGTFSRHESMADRTTSLTYQRPSRSCVTHRFLSTRAFGTRRSATRWLPRMSSPRRTFLSWATRRRWKGR